MYTSPLSSSKYVNILNCFFLCVFFCVGLNRFSFCSDATLELDHLHFLINRLHSAFLLLQVAS